MNITQRKGTPSLNKCAYQVSQTYCKRKLPAYASRLQERLKSGASITNDVFLVIGSYNAYLKAKSIWYGGNVALTYHPDSKPDQFDWPVQNQSVLIFDLTARGITSHHTKALAFELLNAGALVVRYITPDYNIIEFKGDGYANPITH